MTPGLDSIAENRVRARWAELLDPCPSQLNRVHEADAELIPSHGDQLLALSMDTIAEEIALGFYRRPETMGWMGVTACLSDLAAVGAAPLGVVVSVGLPHDADPSLQEGLAAGFRTACRAAGTFILGGDTNAAERPSVTGCAVGMVHRDRLLTRKGCRSGDLVYASGLLGAGAAAAARAVLDLPAELYAETDYHPLPRLAEARLLPGYATATMDSSDGLVATLDQLGRLNDVGFTIDARSPADLLEPGARRVCETLGAPPVAMLAAHHGEFELVFTVAAADQRHFECSAAAGGFRPLLLGRTTDERGLMVAGQRIDGARIRNLADELGDDLKRYLQELLGLLASA